MVPVVNALLDTLPIAVAALLAAAALLDVALRIIPNVIPVALLVGGLVLRLHDGGIVAGVALAASVFVVAMLCWRRGWLGGGDMKLLAAMALVVPPIQVPHFLLVTALVGGVLSLIYLVLSRTVRLPLPGRRTMESRNLLFRVLRAERWRICRGAPLPYGCAIAAGGIILLLR